MSSRQEQDPALADFLSNQQVDSDAIEKIDAAAAGHRSNRSALQGWQDRRRQAALGTVGVVLVVVSLSLKMIVQAIRSQPATKPPGVKLQEDFDKLSPQSQQAVRDAFESLGRPPEPEGDKEFPPP